MTQLRHKYLRRKSCRVSQLVVTWTHDNAAGNPDSAVHAGRPPSQGASAHGPHPRQFAEEIGVSQATITNAENDNSKVRRITLNAWSLRTGVPVVWLETGEDPADPQGPDGGVPVTSRYVVPQTPRLRARSAA